MVNIGYWLKQKKSRITLLGLEICKIVKGVIELSSKVVVYLWPNFYVQATLYEECFSWAVNLREGSISTPALPQLEFRTWVHMLKQVCLICASPTEFKKQRK